MRPTFLLCLLCLVSAPLTVAQKKTTIPAAPLLTRTVSRHEVRRFGYGGTFTVVGAPRGSITVQGWNKNEIDVSAEIEVKGATEDDMSKLVAVTGFLLDDDSNHMSLITAGTHDKSYMKQVGKSFPKQLLALPWKIDYTIHVPQITDVEINGGSGAVALNGVEGLLRITLPQGDVDLRLDGRIANVTVGMGNVKFAVPTRSWRGSGVDIQLAAGRLDVELQPGFSGDVDADILRTGKIENAYGLEARERNSIGEKSLRGRAGAGGPSLKFTVGDGEIHITKAAGQ